MGFCVEYKKPKNWHFFIPVYSALSSSGDIEHSSGCLKGDKCERVKANIRKKILPNKCKYVHWPFNGNFPDAFSVYWERLG